MDQISDKEMKDLGINESITQLRDMLNPNIPGRACFILQ